MTLFGVSFKADVLFVFQLLSGCHGWWIIDLRFNHTNGLAVVTQTDRPKSVRNLCVIEFFGGAFCVVTLLFGFFFRCRGFCLRTESDLFLFFLRDTRSLWLTSVAF